MEGAATNLGGKVSEGGTTERCCSRDYVELLVDSDVLLEDSVVTMPFLSEFFHEHQKRRD